MLRFCDSRLLKRSAHCRDHYLADLIVAVAPTYRRTFTRTSRQCENAEHQRQRQLSRSRRTAVKEMEAYHRYKNWKLPQLMSRIEQLEGELEGMRLAGVSSQRQRAAGKTTKPGDLGDAAAVSTANADQPWSRRPKDTPPKKVRRAFDFSKMPVRKIALRFAYDGADFAGLASQGDGIPSSQASAAAFSSAPAALPTVEIVLWNALCATHLVDPSQGFRGAGWARSGRTDSGVSAAGQVVSFWIRSNKVDERELRKEEEMRLQQRYQNDELAYVVSDGEEDDGVDEPAQDNAGEGATSHVHDPWTNSPLQEGVSREDGEIEYVAAINRLLPPTIRVLSWSPVRPSFDARHNTRYRHYKYFFHSGPPASLQPPLTHPSHRTSQPRLNIAAMQEAASYLLGEHDFRNFCKVDGSKQITNFRRRIDGVSIDKVESGWSDGTERNLTQLTGLPRDDEEVMYVLNLRGTAFLYHQVRDIMAVLFLVGAGLERPSIVKELLNVKEGAWAWDKKWLLDAGVSKFGEVKLPRGTATELDGATAAEPDVQTEEAIQAGVPADKKVTSGDGGCGQGQLTTQEDDCDAQLSKYDQKPEYVMAADRPLVLWECGYRPKDVSWRSGKYDGPITPSTRDSLSISAERALITGSSKTNQEMYETWAQHSISAEIWRHFYLASGNANTGGVVGSGTLYEDARWPAFSSPTLQYYKNGTDHTTYQRSMVAFGNGIARPIVSWKGLRNGKMEETPEVKNEKWLRNKRNKKAVREGKKDVVAKDVEEEEKTASSTPAVATASAAAGVDV